MEVANILVGLDGSQDTTVPKYGVTPAEALLLRAIHGGGDAVADITITGEVKRSPVEEVRRLAQMYHARSEDGPTYVEKLFGGIAPHVPMTFAEIGIEDEAPVAPVVTPKAKRASASASAGVLE